MPPPADPSPIIGRARRADIPDLLAIRTAVTENRMTRAELTAAGITDQALAESLRGDNQAAWLARAGGLATGFSMARARTGDLFALFVRPGWDHAGLGACLLRHAEAWLAAKGVIEAWLLTGGEPGLRAPGFYAAQGWRQIGREPDGQLRFVKTLY